MHAQIAYPSYKLLVNYDQTLAEMILAGRYDWVNSDITAEHFPVTGEGEKSVEVTLFHFDRPIISEDAIREMDQAGFRPARIEELLALGAAQPDLQREFPIVELGSVWVGRGGCRDAGYLDCRGSKRELVLHWFDSGWDGHCRFAAIRK